MVECTGLENRRTFTGTEGSNPSPSARFKAYVDQDCFWGPVAQLDRASDFGSEGRGFESFRARMVRPASLGLAGRCFFRPLQRRRNRVNRSGLAKWPRDERH